MNPFYVGLFRVSRFGFSSSVRVKICGVGLAVELKETPQLKQKLAIEEQTAEQAGQTSVAAERFWMIRFRIYGIQLKA